MFKPQHLRVASSCGEKQPTITDRLSQDGCGESFSILKVVLDSIMSARVSSLEALNLAAAEVRQRVARRVWGPISPFCRSPPPNLPLGNLTSTTHECLAPALPATAVLPAPTSTGAIFVPISARGEQEQESGHAGPARETQRWSSAGKDRWHRRPGLVRCRLAQAPHRR